MKKIIDILNRVFNKKGIVEFYTMIEEAKGLVKEGRDLLLKYSQDPEVLAYLEKVRRSSLFK